MTSLRFAFRPPRERDRSFPSFLRCFIGLLLVRGALKCLDAPRTIRWLEGRTNGGTGRAPGEAAELARRVTQAGVFFPGRALCLEQSLLLHHLLRRRKLDSALRFGVRIHPFAAHAWVEHGGVPIAEDPERLGHFLPMSAPGRFEHRPSHEPAASVRGKGGGGGAS